MQKELPGQRAGRMVAINRLLAKLSADCPDGSAVCYTTPERTQVAIRRGANFEIVNAPVFTKINAVAGRPPHAHLIVDGDLDLRWGAY